MSARALFDAPLSVVNVGLERFLAPIRAHGADVVGVQWRPPENVPLPVSERRRLDALTDAPNRQAFDRLLRSRPFLVDVRPAGEVIRELGDGLILHAGPPLGWEAMIGPMRGAVIGALQFEGLAGDAKAAEALAGSGRVRFAPNHHYAAVGPMAGVTSASMPVWVVENRPFGNRAYASLNEGLGKVLRYGAFAPPVIDRLRWTAEVLAPSLARALETHGPLDLTTLAAEALAMGDELHNRNRAATSLFTRRLAPSLAATTPRSETLRQVFEFLDGNDHFYLNISMAAAKATADAARGIEDSSLVVCMSRNGRDFGIQVAGRGDRWFTGPAQMVDGLYLPGFGPGDAAPDMGDSVITETVGLGGFAMAAAPAIVQFVGGSARLATETTTAMHDITVGEHDALRVPGMDFRGVPVGIDLVRVVDSGILPVINTGIAHREAGVGMIGAGLVAPPAACFADALASFR
ncbi:MAG: DUF1116 domain-containing protein [Spirochaetaceae bacterium]|nr:DUF1116 domain-containing protein [Spirochaetaceae bacterium]